jgi:hypothetical protein
MSRRTALLGAGQRYRAANATPGSVVGAASVASSTITLSCAMPTGTVQNDVMVAAVSTDWDTYADITAPTGWTVLTGQDNGANTVNVKVFTKTAGASEAGPYLFHQGASSDGVCSIVTLRNVTEAGAIASATFTGTTSTTRTAPSITGATAGSVLVCGAMCDGPGTSAITWTPPSGMTEQADISSGSFTSHTVATLLNPGSPTGTKAFTASASIPSVGGNQWSAVFLQGTGGGGGGGGGGVTLTPTQPGAFVYSDTTAAGYNNPGALVVVGRTNYNAAAFQTISAAGGTVLLYIDAIVWNNFGRYHDLLFNSSVYGAAVPEWPGPVNANTGGNLADFRVGSLLLTKLQSVLELAVSENPHLGGFFADDLGSRSWFPGFDWSTFGTTNQNDYRAGAIAVAQVFRNVCNNHGLITICNGTWENGTTASAGGGYPTQNAHGCSLMEGGTVEHHATADAFWQGYISPSAQWGSASSITGSGKPVMVVIGSASSERQQWVDLGVAYYTTQTDYGSAPTPWGSFHATGLPSHTS